MQARQGNRAAKWVNIQTHAQWAQERVAKLGAADAIMAPIIAAAMGKNRKNKKNKKKRNG